MWKCARLGVRSEEVWSRFAQRVLMTGSLASANDVSLIFRAFGMIKYRDLKARHRASELGFRLGLGHKSLTSFHHFAAVRPWTPCHPLFSTISTASRRTSWS